MKYKYVNLLAYCLVLNKYCSWGSKDKSTEVVCHSLLQWTTFRQNSPPSPVHLGWPYMAWLSFVELDKAVVHVIRLASFLWLWFQSVCPLMPSLSTYKTKIMASGSITSWQVYGETVETVADFILLGSKLTADGECSHEIKRCLLLGRKVMTKLDSILKSREITLPTKVHLVKAMVFPVAMYGCESWTIKKAERRRIDTFELWCWRRLLRVPWTARRCNQSILKEISPECSLEGLILKLKL